MQANRFTGWLLIGLGGAFAIGGFALGMGAAGVGVGALMALGGWLSVYIGDANTGPLDGTAELHRYGRPANAEVLAVGDPTLGADGTRTAELRLRVSPVNESRYKTKRTVVLPGGRVPVAGSTLTVKFDPQRRRNFVVLDQHVEVKDHVTLSAEAMFGGLKA